MYTTIVAVLTFVFFFLTVAPIEDGRQVVRYVVRYLLAMMTLLLPREFGASQTGLFLFTALFFSELNWLALPQLIKAGKSYNCWYSYFVFALIFVPAVSMLSCALITLF